jgi:chorismate mutase
METGMTTDTMIRSRVRETGMTKNAVREIIVAADEAALNHAIMENQIEPDKIVSVMFQPGQSMAIGDHGPKYRVLYRL